MLTEQEFQILAERYLDMVYRICLNWFRSPPDAEDAAQTAMIRLWKAGPTGLTEEQLRYWLARVTINVCKSMSRAPWRTRTVSLEICQEVVFRESEHQALYDSVMVLPAKYRVPLYLYYFEGYSVGEVAELLQMNPSTVQTRLARARERLKRELEEQT